MKKTAQIFKALSDETRLRVMKLLQERELCVCELIQVLEMSQPRISRHLSVLKNAGLVNDRREGKWVYYSIPGNLQKRDIKVVIDALFIMEQDNHLLKKDKDRLKEAVRLSEVDSCCRTKCGR